MMNGKPMRRERLAVSRIPNPNLVRVEYLKAARPRDAQNHPTLTDPQAAGEHRTVRFVLRRSSTWTAA